MKHNLIPLKILFTVGVLCQSVPVLSQDTIATFRGKKIPAQIVGATADSLFYKKPDDQPNTKQAIHKMMVSEIRFANGTKENFFTEAEKSISKETLKTEITALINAHGFEEDSDKEKYLATFEGDYLRLAIIKNTKVKSKGFLFDFASVFQFHPVSKRSETNSYINIYVAFLDNPKKMVWAKQKLIMRVKGYENALEIQRKLQNLNRILKEEKK